MIRTEALTFAVGKFRLNQINIHVKKGECFALLGQPGSGKTIFLECLCGLNQPESGRIIIAGEDLTDKEPRKRRIGYVPQDYALFPHLSVEKNIGFGLKGQLLARHQLRRKVEEKADLLKITHLLKRSVGTLSGGEKQRTALARALAIEPSVLLLDEPVSALDENTRDSVCAELRRLHEDLGITTIHVSHNLEEAFSVADRGGILNKGVFEQIGTLDELLRQPVNEFTARFMRCGNIFSAHADGQDSFGKNTYVKTDKVKFLVPGIHQGEVKFIIRPENIDIQKTLNTEIQKTETRLPAEVTNITDRGTYVRLDLSIPTPLSVHMPHYAFTKLHIQKGNKIYALIKPKMIHVLPRQKKEKTLLNQ